MKKCPRCKEQKLEKYEIKNALSRRDNKTYICSDCGTEEGMFDFANSKTLEPTRAINALKERVWLDDFEYDKKKVIKFICDECKAKKLRQIGVQMKIGIGYIKIGECEICKNNNEELYSYIEVRE